MSGNVNFKIGDAVVYPSHGVGTLISEETENIAGIECTFLIIELKKDKMILRLPKNKAIKAGGLRPISDISAIEKVNNIFVTKAKKNRNHSWSKRAQELEALINSGDLEVVATVIRDLFPSVEQASCSYSERTIFEGAFSRLVSEYSEILKISIDETKPIIRSMLKNKEIINIKYDSESA